jgi:hypothetical protein
MFYSNLDVNRTVENELKTKIDLKPLEPPRFHMTMDWVDGIFINFEVRRSSHL